MPDTTTPTVLRREPGAPEREPRRFRRRRRATDLTLAIGVPVVLLVLWQAASEADWIDSRLYPSPTDIVRQGRELAADGLLWEQTWVSTRRVLQGYALGSLAGVAVGLAMGTWRPARVALDPILTALYTVPKLALLPVFLTIFGFGEAPVIVLIAVTVFFFVWISTTAAILSVHEGYRDAARVFGVNRWQMFRHVLLPASAPQVFVGLRIAAGVAVLVLIGVEFVLGGRGLGHLIEQGRVLFQTERIYVGIVVVAVLGFVFMSLVRVIGRRVTPWSREDDGMTQI